ncbi:hypothetical protein HWC13_gp055 [Nodularia phage vB_NspS-kac68v161]|uniref:Uncharacterized protein n=1 Tax=Nodularia phage vB_NspS-kac68v161 TaxID=2557582 RepID=A0A482MJH9_9CAUD|nr:hypothetical protein HWC13_gp055 [Nodularia phage vB_NspS-kac68v161]QBQ73705.1 hypothetical protein kac68v161_gp055 [Nodularia phage vB_NspS-kac68v161]
MRIALYLSEVFSSSFFTHPGHRSWYSESFTLLS